MKKNGKNIKCKNCNKEFYISESRFETRRYCSKFCSMVGIFKDFKQFEKKCVICGENFLIIHPLKIQNKTCSGKCHYGLVKKLSKKCYENKKNTIKKLNCKECKKQFNGQELYKTFYCSKQCQIENYKKSRIGKNNPAYRNGWSTRDVKKKFIRLKTS